MCASAFTFTLALRLLASIDDVCNGHVEGIAVSTYVVTYDVDHSTKVKFEIEPTDGFRPAGPGQVLGRVQDAVAPAVEAAKAVLDKVKEARPDQVEVTFGVKVSGEATWFVAKSAAEGSFEVKLTWARGAAETSPGGTSDDIKMQAASAGNAAGADGGAA